MAFRLIINSLVLIAHGGRLTNQFYYWQGHWVSSNLEWHRRHHTAIHDRLFRTGRTISSSIWQQQLRSRSSKRCGADNSTQVQPSNDRLWCSLIHKWAKILSSNATAGYREVGDQRRNNIICPRKRGIIKINTMQEGLIATIVAIVGTLSRRLRMGLIKGILVGLASSNNENSRTWKCTRPPKAILVLVTKPMAILTTTVALWCFLVSCTFSYILQNTKVFGQLAPRDLLLDVSERTKLAR